MREDEQGNGHVTAESMLLSDCEMYKTLVEHLLTGVYIIRGSKYVYVNECLAESIGYTREELLAMDSFLDLVHPDDREMVKENLRRRFAGEQSTITYEMRFLHRDGSVLYAETRGRLDWFENQPAVMGSVLNITHRKRAEAALVESEARNRALLDAVPDLLFRMRRDGVLLDYRSNRIGAELSEKIALGWHIRSIIDKDPAHKVLYFAEKAIKSQLRQVFELNVMTEAGRSWFEIRMVAVTEDEVLAVARDISERKIAEDKWIHLSFHDSVTKLYNRAYFDEAMKRAVLSRQQGEVGVIICDLDGLKLMNDTLGHEQGDIILAATAGILQSAFRPDDVVARIGGDEFAILLPQCDEVLLEEACLRIRRKVAEYNQAHDLCIGLSIGAAVGGGRSPEELLRAADDLMYREKLQNSANIKEAIMQTIIQRMEDREFTGEGHCRRMESWMDALAAVLRFSNQKREELLVLVRFHDIGKIGIAKEVLLRPGPLSPEEYIEVQRHAELGYRLARSIPELSPVADLILKHHEWWDGKGYPLGLKGEEIPQEARMLAIVDAYEAMTGYRPYCQRKTAEEAVAELQKCAGSQFDPYLVKVFVQLIQTGKII